MSEIAYVIPSQNPFERESLCFDLAEVVREAGTYRFLSAGEPRPIAQWRALAKKGADEEALNFLLKEEQLLRKRQGELAPLSSSARLRVPAAQLFRAFTLLAATQKLHCGGKQLIMDLFEPAEFYYEAADLKEGRIAVEGRLRWRDKSVGLGECQVVGPGAPSWFVQGWLFKTFRPSLTWKQWEAIRPGIITLEGASKRAFLERLHPEDPDEPRLEIRGGGSLKGETSPYPFLVLKDRWGACADLWMDYGKECRIAFHDPSPLFETREGRKRQGEAEKAWEKDLLETGFIKKIGEDSHYYCPLDRVTESLSFLLEVGWPVQDREGRRLVHESDRAFQFHDRGDCVGISGRIRYGEEEVDLSSSFEACRRHDLFIPLSPQTLGLISLESRQALLQIGEEVEWTAGEARIAKNRWRALSSLGECSPASPALTKLKQNLESFSGIEEAPPSPAFQGKLRPYQQQGVNWLSFLEAYGFHGILADEMGLGKTVQTLAFLSRLPEKGPHLIVMPTSLLFNWRREIEGFLPSWRCVVHQGPLRAKSEEELLNADLLLTSYTTLRLDLVLLRRLSYSCLILDEAQMIKNAQTQTAQAVRTLSAKLRLCLTGTPVENRPQELWAHFHFLMPDLFGSQRDFEAVLQAGQSDRRHLETLKRKAAPFILKRQKREVATDLPPRIDQTVQIAMSEEQRLLYDRFASDFKRGLLKKAEAEGVGKHRLEILEAILRLRQLCCHPLLLSPMLEERPPASAKFDLLLEELETLVEEGRKVLIYSQFTSMLKLMIQAAAERGWPYGYLDGSTANREATVDRFQSDSSQLLFFVSLKAGGVGLNLTAADYVYLYDPWWNEAVEEQAINRAHRMGRAGSVIAKRLVMAESIEEKMAALKSSKRLTAEALLEGEGLPTQLTLEELKLLIG